ncbi:MAG: ATP-dependent DNA helicase UvrD2 [Acidimicrobiaceae bacterium]|nr:ATP-dependent DNA helicase UvrD2 [Acidimicrobiaceae bacterium]MYG56000.1 ATP-dependent DNA helicase UvrD2 [Acidimicrobiaceae bacterium]MYJ99993.1 ATP-dependent DNA helicase UvrD2 [Acidimicrobiaceae bacterium]
MIACGHCGGRHSTVEQVRTCSLDAPSADAHSEPPPMRPTKFSADRSGLPKGFRPVVLEPHWQRLAGPEALGRNLVVNPGQAVPEPWAHCERIVVDGQPGAFNQLREFRRTRSRAVIELRIDLDDDDPVLDVEYWYLSPNTDLEGETLQHLVFDHAVDARIVDQPTIRAISRALSAGATLITEGPGDIATNEGPAWCDGGPLDWFDDIELGAPVIPAVHLAIGSLATIRNVAPNADLADDQLRAVAHSGGGARIIAPAGSGKTRVLTERARHLVRDRGIDPATVCLVAFNVRARQEMQERTGDLAGLQIRTLNSLALAILSGSGPFRSPDDRNPPRVIDEHEVRQILSDLVGGRRVAMADPLAVWIEALTATRLGLRSPSAVEQEFGSDVRGFADVLPQFRERLADDGVVDFDEQILGAIEVLCADPEARATAQRACGVLLVDEFQDLTPAHVLLIRLLAGPAAKVFGVGDDDQTIYGYAGASPSWLIDFADLFPGSAAHDLKVNYRCPPSVVDAAATLLTHNRRRIDKTIQARRGRAALEPEIEVMVGDDPMGSTIARVSELRDQGIPLSSIAVLARVNVTLLGPMILLEEAGVATTKPVGPSFMERTGVAGALAWLRLAVADENSLPSDALETAIRRPPRGISRRLAGWVGEQRSPRQLKALAKRLKQERDQLKVLEFTAQLEALRKLADRDADTERLLAAIRDDIGLGRALDNRLDASRRSVDRSTHGDDLAALLAVAKRCQDPAEFPGWLAERLNAPRSHQPGITLSTVHRVKGQEWPHVIVHDASEGLMPHRLSSDVEEERRVFHVAITRASESVTIAAGRPASRFVAEMRTPGQPEPEPRAPISASADPKRTPTPSTRRTPVDPPAVSTLDEARLREQLKTWRSTTAKTAGVPAYVVFNDATLYQIAALRPQTDDDLLSISGIGPVKLERYGEDILAILDTNKDN